ncbi:MAG: response regulator [Lewinellaceae bacterium]|nr:response regulator [Lewinellaceae bacterium]
MRILIVEDEPLYASQLEMLIDRMGYEVVGAFDNAFDALDCFHREKPDLLLLDINLAGEVDGIELAARANRARAVPVVFITSLQDDETFARAQQTHPAAFIIKPFDELQLQRSIELAVAQLAKSPETTFEAGDLVLQDSLFIKVREKLEKVSLAEILYAEADDRYSELHTSTGRKFVVRIPLGQLEEKLNTRQFARTHRSFLINLNQIQSVDLQENFIQVKDKSIPLSKGYRDQVLERLEQL